MSSDISVDDFLAHYGVKGMKWGVRKDRDPAREQQKQAEKAVKRETRAKKYDARATKYQTALDKVTAKEVNFLNRRSLERQVKALNDAKSEAVNDAKRIRAGKRFTKQQQKVVIGAAVAATIIVANETYKAADAGEFNRLNIKGKAFVNGEPVPKFKRRPNLGDPDMDLGMLQFAVINKINPDYGAIGTKQNCRRATFAYEMRRRGFDVAATRSVAATGQNSGGVYNATNTGAHQVSRRMSLFLKDAVDQNSPFKSFLDANKGPAGTSVPIEVSGLSTHLNIFEALSKQPNGARGELGVMWKSGSGHSLAWEILKGKPVIIDAQSGKVYKDAMDLSKVAEMVSAAGFTRLDNVALNQDFLLRWLKDAK